MTQQIVVNRFTQKASQLDMIRRNDRNTLLISEYNPVASDLMGLSWIFIEDNEEDWNQ